MDSNRHHKLMVMIAALFLLHHGVLVEYSAASWLDVPFDNNYGIVYGNDHVKFLDPRRTQLELSLDSRSGAGFGSKEEYASGSFRVRLELPKHDLAGIVTTFYLQSGTEKHDELDFEILGNREGKPIYVQTNVFADGVGNREQRIRLPFELRGKFVEFGILWNPHQIVFTVGPYPIRVFKNNRAIGVGYPSKPMQVLGTIWDGDSWATDGGRTKIDWSKAPFTARYNGFGVDGCAASRGDCYSTKYWWNRKEHWGLDREARVLYERARRFLVYDYCTDTKQHPVPPPECRSNSFL